MDAMEVLDYDERRFLCSSEQLFSRAFHAVVRRMISLEGPIHTLVIASEVHDASWRALVQAKELAVEWALKHPRSDYE